MEFATVGLSTLLPKLAQLLHEKYRLHKGTREGIQFLHTELEAMHAALEKVGEVPIEQLDKPRRIWARNVRELSYDMEDIVDAYMVGVEGAQPPSKTGAKNIFKKMKRKFTKALAQDEVAKEIDDIKMRAKELAEQHARLARFQLSLIDYWFPHLNCIGFRSRLVSVQISWIYTIYLD
jgi:disease resistance protein RPM1